MRNFTLRIIQFGLSSAVLAAETGCEFAADKFSSSITDPSTIEKNLEGLTSVSISSFLPSSTSVTVQQSGSQNFVVSATSQRGQVTYKWYLDGAEVQSGSVGTFSFLASSYSTGTHTLIGEATDGSGVERVTWSVKKNAAPTISSYSPTSSPYKVAVGGTASFSIVASDANSDALSYSWSFNSDTSLMTVTSSGGNSSATISATQARLGAHTVTVTVSDGSATASYSWTLQVNGFLSQCNNLTSGQICSYVGYANVGLSSNPSTEKNSFLIRPRAIVADGNNFVFSDDLNHVVWYWNKGSSDVTRFNQTMTAGSLKIVAGVGTAGSTGLNGLATDAALNTPIEIAFADPTGGDERLYIVDAGNNRLLKINSGGVISQVSPTSCTNPRGVDFFPDKSTIVVGCNGSNRIVKFDGTTTTTILGTGTAGSTGDGGVGTSALVSAPTSVRTDPAGNVYVYEPAACRIRFLNRTSSNITFYAGSASPRTINGNGGVEASSIVHTIVGVTGAATCVDLLTAGATLSTARDEIHPLAAGGSLHTNAAAVTPWIGNWDATTQVAQTIIIPQYTGQVVSVVNNSANSLSIAGTTVGASKIKYVVGKGNYADPANATAILAAGYSGEGSTGRLTRVSGPVCAHLDGSNNLWYCDYGNLRLRYIDSATSVGTLGLGAGIQRAGFVGNNTNARETLTSSPIAVVYDTSAKTLFFSDSGNHRVRAVDQFGNVTDAVGRGQGSALTDDDFPGNITFNSPHGLALHGSDKHLVMVDRVNNVVRIWNRSTSDQTINGLYVQAGRVSRLAGTGTTGCTTTTMNSRDALLTTPEGVASDGTNIFISDTACHCIRKIDNTGSMSVVMGTCGSSGNTNTEGGTTVTSTSVLLNNPRQIYLDSSGNLYVTDYSNNKIRYANIALAGSAKLFGGAVTVPVGQVATIVGGGAATTDGVLSTGAAVSGPFGIVVSGTTGTTSSSGTVCFVSYGHANVRCMPLSSGLVSTIGARAPGANNQGGPLGYEQEGIPGTGLATTPAVYVRFNSPRMLSWDDSTGLFIADTGGNLIRYIK
jgi:hypothetical protein